MRTMVARKRLRQKLKKLYTNFTKHIQFKCAFNIAWLVKAAHNDIKKVGIGQQAPLFFAQLNSASNLRGGFPKELSGVSTFKGELWF